MIQILLGILLIMFLIILIIVGITVLTIVSIYCYREIKKAINDKDYK